MKLRLSSALIYSLENRRRQVDAHSPRVCDMKLGLSSALIYSLENWCRQVDAQSPRVCNVSHPGSNLLNFDPLSSSLQPTR